MRPSCRAVHIEFFLEKVINGGVQGKGKTRRPSDAEPAIDVKASRTLEKKIDLCSAQLKWPRALGIVEIARAPWLVILRHNDTIVTHRSHARKT
jgi:hypothetical protein